MKLKNPVYNLVEYEKEQINNLEDNDAIKIHSKKMNLFIALRNIREI